MCVLYLWEGGGKHKISSDAQNFLLILIWVCVRVSLIFLLLRQQTHLQLQAGLLGTNLNAH